MTGGRPRPESVRWKRNGGADGIRTLEDGLRTGDLQSLQELVDELSRLDDPHVSPP